MTMKYCLLAAMLCTGASALADDNDKAREDMQRALNQQVMASPFNPGDIKKAEAYSEEAKKQGVVPMASPPGYWGNGWTCGNLIGYRYYNYYDYQNCIYYHHYYGHYWR